MPSFLIRGLAHYFAASVMESRARRQSSFSPSSRTSSDDNKKVSNADLASWQIHMRWLIPLAQATGFQIVIDNPKSHEQIIIDQNTKVLPELTLQWMQKYNKQELLEWMEKEKKKQQQKEEERRKYLEARRIEETRGRARFGNSFSLGEQNAQNKKSKSQNVSKGNYVIPILCLLYVFIIVLIGLWVFNSSIFEAERHVKDIQKYYAIMHEAENSPITEFITPEGFRFDMNEAEFNSLNEINITDGSTKSDWLFGNTHYVGNLYGGEFHEGKLVSYEITISGCKNNGTVLKLNDGNVKQICEYYKTALGKGGQFTALPDYYYLDNNYFYIFTKDNMAITLHYYSSAYSSDYNRLSIKCENRPVSVLKDRKKDTASMYQEDKDDNLPTKPFTFSADSSFITIHPTGCTPFMMIKVEGGVFTMGNNEEYDSGPEHEVELSDFYIAETEVPQSLWKDIMGNSGSALLERNQSPKKPADGVSWDDAQAFIKALNSLTGQEFRLPTEAEWEFAAKGGNKSCGYKYSGSYDIGSVAWYGRNAYNVKPLGPDYGTHYVGEKRPNELGLYDMSGNVWEWCQDWHKDYSRKRQKNPKGPSTGRAKVVRGGCFKSSESLCTVTRRKWMWPEENSFVGVRLALSINKDN